MSIGFYNKVAKKFGGYSYGTNNPEYITEYSEGEPEADFKKHILDFSGKVKSALDVGCGDCKFAFSIAGNFREIVGIDNSKELLKVAKSKQKELKNRNIKYFQTDANKLNFEKESFDLAFSRRGPTPYRKIYRVLKPGGVFIVIGIGEKDTMDLKVTFGRGQSYGKWNKSKLMETQSEVEKIGYEVIYAKDYFYDEYYKTYKDMDIFLQGVPIFENFDSQKDNTFLKKYADKYKTEKGINLPRHRVVFVFRKPL
jgi:ubiquinone/menaquinone biosynthesis C-methylase UbiE